MMPSIENKPKIHLLTSQTFSPQLGLKSSSEELDEDIDLVLPSAPVKGNLKLSNLDKRVFNTWSPYMYVFEKKQQKSSFMDSAHLKESLADALNGAPVFSGILITDQGAPALTGYNTDLAINLEGSGVWFTTTKINASYSELNINHFNYEILPPNFKFKRVHDIIVSSTQDTNARPPLLAIKASYLECGSCLLMVYANHLVADGKAVFEFMKSWSQLFQNPSLKHLPSYDMRHLVNPYSEINKEALDLIEEWKIPFSGFKGFLAPVRFCRLSINKLDLKYLKLKLINGQENWFSSDDLISALVWRAMTRARKLDNTMNTRFQRTIDIRSNLNLPDNSLGNIFIYAFTNPITAKTLLESSLSDIAYLLCQTKLKARDQNHVQNVITALHHCTDPILSTIQSVDFIFGPDMVASSYASFNPEQVHFDSPATCILRVPYFEGHLVTNINKSEFVANVGVSQNYYMDFIKDAEITSLGLTTYAASLE